MPGMALGTEGVLSWLIPSFICIWEPVASPWPKPECQGTPLDRSPTPDTTCQSTGLEGLLAPMQDLRDPWHFPLILPYLLPQGEASTLGSSRG